jgi:NagD protein
MPDLAKLRHIVLDMDGTIYLGGTLFPFTLPFLSQLKQLGIGYTFVTNNCSHSRAEYVERLRGMGIRVEPESISTSAQATVYYLRSHLPDVKRLFVLGTAGLNEDLEDAGFEVVNDQPDAVVVGFDSTLTYDRLAQTAYWISQKLPYIATHPDRVCPTDKPIVLPDCGAICALLESATGRKPDAIPGKPSPAMLQTVIQRYRFSADETAMVGDRLYTDVRMAREAGAVAILTLSGEAQLSDVEIAPDNQRPDLVVADLSDLLEQIRKQRAR